MNFLNKGVIFVFLIMLYPIIISAQSKKLKIDGRVDGLKEGTKIYLKLRSMDPGMVQTILFDSTVVKGGRFNLEGSVSNGPQYFVLDFEKPYPLMTMFLNNDRVQISGDLNETPKSGNISEHIKVSGSKSDSLFRTLLPLIRMTIWFQGNTKAYLKSIEDSIGYNYSLVETVSACKQAFNAALFSTLFSMVKIDSQNFGIPLLLIDLYPWIGKESFLGKLYDGLSDDVKESYYGELLKNKLKTRIGQPFGEFEIKSADNSSIPVSELISKSKLTLLYFWSYSDKQNADYLLELLKWYNKYSAKGLSIISICVDTNIDIWKKELTKNNFPWYQVNDGKGKLNGIGKLYEYNTSVRPFNILIDSNGKILDKYVSGLELRLQVDKIFEDN